MLSVIKAQNKSVEDVNIRDLTNSKICFLLYSLKMGSDTIKTWTYNKA